MKSKGGGTGMVGDMTGGMTQYVKGLKTRTDQTSGKGRLTSTIIDLAAKRMIVLDHDKKEARVIDMAALSDTLAKAGATDISFSITPTAQTRQIAGQTCTVHDMKVAVPMAMGNARSMTMVMSGPQCLVKNGPGQAEYARVLSRGIGEWWLPRRNAGQDAAGDGESDDRHVSSKMAELGRTVRDRNEHRHRSAAAPMAEMMKKMNNTITTEVTSVSTAAIDAAMFEIPADYKVSKRYGAGRSIERVRTRR